MHRIVSMEREGILPFHGFKIMGKHIPFTFCLLALLVCGCNVSTVSKDFTYKYSMESVCNFKVEFQLNSDSSYVITKENYFFDRFEGKHNPVEKEGTATKSEFETFRKLIRDSKIDKMEDAYGFNEEKNSGNSVLYMVTLTQNGKSKSVFINAGTKQPFSKKFIALIEYTNSYINAHEKP